MSAMARSRNGTLTVLGRWEAMLVLLLVLVCTLNAQLSPYFLDVDNLLDSTFTFAEKAIVAFPLAILIIGGEIDVSVASIIALAAVMMGVCADAGGGTAMIVATGMVTGLLAGLVNGWLVTSLGVHSIVITIGTLSLFRGIATAIVTNGAFATFPPGLFFFGRAYLGGRVPFELVFVLVEALAFGVLLHMTVYGRRVFVMGNNVQAARYSGIATARYKRVMFAATGLFSGIAAVFLVSRLGSVRLNIAQGWELQIITMVVLGGVSIAGGAGTILGVVLSILLIGALMFGLALINMPGLIVDLCLGVLLIGAISLPRLIALLARRRIF